MEMDSPSKINAQSVGVSGVTTVTDVLERIPAMTNQDALGGLLTSR
jgi:hypothetical protein